MMDRTALGDITNVTSPTQVRKKRNKDGTLKHYVVARKIRKSMDCLFDSENDKHTFESKFDAAKDKLECKSNEQLLTKLLDLVLQDSQKTETRTSHSSSLSTSDDIFLCSWNNFLNLWMY